MMRILSVACFLLFLTLASAQTGALEIRALSALYNATGGPNWRIQWNMGTDPCIMNWPGVKCRPAGGNNQFQIWSLTVQGNNLVGTIPTDIGLLTNIQFLFLSGNALSGTIPAEINSLRQLVQVGFDKNQLTGGFPDLSQLLGLQIVYLQNNLLTGTLLPFSKLPALQYLWLSGNNLEGTLPNELGDLFNLQQLGIDGNKLTGTVPSGFGVRQNLFQAFYGQGNQFSGAFPTNLCRVATCDLSGPTNVFTCPLPVPPCCHVTVCK